MKYKSFIDFPVWKQSIKFAEDIYRLTNQGIFSKDYGLKDQIRRSSVSISSNIAEGFERNNNKEFIRFLTIAKGSAGEARSQLFLSKQIRYTTENEYELLENQISDINSSIGGLISYLKQWNIETQSPSVNPQIR
jgi:four helix bundle protein